MDADVLIAPLHLLTRLFTDTTLTLTQTQTRTLALTLTLTQGYCL